MNPIQADKNRQPISRLVYLWIISLPYAWLSWTYSGISPLFGIKPQFFTEREIYLRWVILPVILFVYLVVGHQIWRRLSAQSWVKTLLLFVAVFVFGYLASCVIEDFVLTDAAISFEFYKRNFLWLPITIVFLSLVGAIFGSIVWLPIYLADRILGNHTDNDA